MTSEAQIGEPAADQVLRTAPYPGPRPFKIREAPLFFGRRREAAQLRSLVLGHGLVLLYAESGAGKTSLLNAGLIPSLREDGVAVFPPVRIRPSSPSKVTVSTIENPFVASVITNWAAEHETGIDGVGDLVDFVELLSRRHETRTEEPRVLIIDQFEELFTQFPGQWDLRADFFAQLQNALDKNPDLRVLLAMREDYLAQTDPYVELLTNRLQHRFRIERLRREQAIGAVTGPVDTTDRTFAPGAAEYLTDELLKIRVRREDETVQVPGEFAEPVQLQIVCSTLWERLDALDEKIDEITIEHIKENAPPKRALADFYGTVVTRAAEEAGIDVLELRRWCESKLITEGGTRALVYRGTDNTRGMRNEVVDRLESEHLIRREERAGEPWYELSHDKFVEAIQSGNRRAYEEHAQLTADLGVHGDPFIRRLDGAIEMLVLGSKEQRLNAMSSVYTVVATGVTLSDERRTILDGLLADLTHDPSSDAETARMAEYLRTLIRGEAFDYESAFRSTYTGARIAEIDEGALSGGTLALLALLTLSTVGAAEVAEWIVSWWTSVPDLALRRDWPVGALVLLWTGIYVAEAYENFPISSWRRSDRLFVHMLTAAVAPLHRHLWANPMYLAVSAWPLNLVLPWLAAAAAAAAANVYWDWGYTLVFLVVLGAATAVMAWCYKVAEF